MPDLTYREINQEVLQSLSPPARWYWGLLAFLAIGMGWGLFCWYYQIETGMGVTGLTIPIGWALYITNFVFWIGIGHAGTLLSAILYLFRVDWRTSVYRAAETMTVFAVLTAGSFPLIHLGRVWVFYWLIPYPNQRHLWPNFKSPLVWDVVAVTTYLTVSVLFLYMGLIPDLAAARDTPTFSPRRRAVYRFFALGWQGEHNQWRHYLRAYMCLAALATPLVISVHSVVSWDFAMSLLPGWHETIFAPYFVAGAIHSGLAMVITLLIPLRKILHLERLVTMRHFEAMAQLNILTGLIVFYAYAVEPFMAWYTGDAVQRGMIVYRALGSYWPYFWIMTFCNALLPLAYFWRKVRRNWAWLLGISLAINVGMWLERYVIIVTSLAHDYMPSAWSVYRPTWVELSVSVGMGCFFMLFFLIAVKLFPAVALAESKEQPAPPEALWSPEVTP
jgi:molybdopterin-containing oxidoreductase family membrane subunit